MERDPIAADARRARRKRHLGAEPSCTLCGFAGTHALRRVYRSVFEAHHVVGRINDSSLTVALCANCHAFQSARQVDLEVDLQGASGRTILDVVIDCLRQLGSLLCDIGERLYTWADRLADLIPALDAHTPEWRQLGEAQP